ncbi:MAG: aa3-type cytochrome c oxidase subunit IV [Hyphomicrobiales bacterium]|nr:MAG: aa3-type cytochrome c oxidase subunit IV [Hyphomicrobiales bacterium]
MSDDAKNAMDYPEHESTYDLFIALSKYGTISMIVLLVLMAIFLV